MGNADAAIAAARCIHASDDFFYAVFGLEESLLLSTLAALMADTGSDLGSTRVLADAGNVCGAYAAYPTNEAATRQAATAKTLLRVAGSEMAAAMARLREFSALVPPLPDASFYLAKIGVLPEARGEGIGAALLEDFESEAAGRGLCSLCLHVRAENERAVRFYERHGWTRTDQRADGYSLMQKKYA
jgi:ribosomal protein S18 acetylase RimI-like enzyme